MTQKKKEYYRGHKERRTSWGELGGWSEKKKRQKDEETGKKIRG